MELPPPPTHPHFYGNMQEAKIKRSTVKLHEAEARGAPVHTPLFSPFSGFRISIFTI